MAMGQTDQVQTRRVLEDEDGLRIDRWFKLHYPDLPFGALQRLLRSGQVRLDGGRVKSSQRVAAGQSVRVPPFPKEGVAEGLAQRRGVTAVVSRAAGSNAAGAAGGPETRREPSRSEGRVPKPGRDDPRAFLESLILYEDREMMVLNKPMGLAVQGGPGTLRHVDMLLESMPGPDGQKPRLVHRLDKDTAGCLVIAKTRLAAATLAKTFRSRSARKIYWALVAGVPRTKQGRISTYLAKGEGRDGVEKMRVASHGDEGADHALTYYALVDQAAQKLAWLSLKPVTGRTHQLRAHMAHIGHPIIGDPKYFDIENWEVPGGIQKKLHLLARRIIIPQPKTGEPVDVSAPLPPHMQQSFNLLGLDTSRYDPIAEAPET